MKAHANPADLSRPSFRQSTCGGKTNQNETTFVNPGYPRGDNGTDTCQVTIEKSPNVCQLRLDFEDFTLAQPDENGLCTTDSFMVRTTVGERLPILCGENGGQHSKYQSIKRRRITQRQDANPELTSKPNTPTVYIDMGSGSANPVVLSVVSNGDRVTRRWKIKINMINCNNLDMAPSGCMQYFRSPSAVIRSFNYGQRLDGRARYLSNLRYTSCVRVEENFCAIKWETESLNSFSFGAPFECEYTSVLLGLLSTSPHEAPTNENSLDNKCNFNTNSSKYNRDWRLHWRHVQC